MAHSRCNWAWPSGGWVNLIQSWTSEVSMSRHFVAAGLFLLALLAGGTITSMPAISMTGRPHDRKNTLVIMLASFSPPAHSPLPN